jgi:hypothetical protein
MPVINAFFMLTLGFSLSFVERQMIYPDASAHFTASAKGFDQRCRFEKLDKQTIFVKQFISAAILLPLSFFAGCNASKAPEAQAPPATPAASAATISASPNPVSIGEGPGTTTVSWNTGDGSAGEVFVLEDGAPEKMFAMGPAGSASAPWIQAGKTFEFRLYAGSDHAKMLAKTQVTGQK